MQKIYFGLFDDHEIIAHGLKKTLNEIAPLKFAFQSQSKCDTLQSFKSLSAEILFIGYPFAKEESRDIVAALRNLCPQVKIIVLSRTIEQENVIKFINDGANCILPTSASLEDLKYTINQVMKKEYYFTELFSHAMLDELKKEK